MKSEKNTPIFKKPVFIVMMLAGLILLLSTIGVIASYTNLSSAKMVVATYGDSGQMFSSNYLKPGTITTSFIYAKTPESASMAQNGVGIVRVSNYSQEKQTIFYDRSINYILTAQLVYDNGDGYVQVTSDNASSIVGQRWISVGKGNNSIILGYNENTDSYIVGGSINSSLLGRQSSTDDFTVTFDKTQVVGLMDPPEGYKKLSVELTATPNPQSSYNDLQPIRGRLSIALVYSEEVVRWVGYFNDEESARNVEPSDETPTNVTRKLDGYNYVIDGYGSAEVTLEWNSNYLELNEGFIVDILGLESIPLADDEGWKTITFTPTSPHYETQF